MKKLKYKHRKVRRIYTEEERQIVIEWHRKGLTDTEICKKFDYGYYFVNDLTTKYWENRMDSKKQ